MNVITGPQSTIGWQQTAIMLDEDSGMIDLCVEVSSPPEGKSFVTFLLLTVLVTNVHKLNFQDASLWDWSTNQDPSGPKFYNVLFWLACSLYTQCSKLQYFNLQEDLWKT